MKRLIPVSIIVFLPKLALAHCPLCTVGAGALAVFAASIGISSMVVGVMIGGFALALSTWLARLPKKNYIPYQRFVLALVVFIGTIVPIMPLAKEYGPLYVRVFGEYGGVFHNTYTVNLFLAGSIIGALLMLVGPYLSKQLTKIRGSTLPFQGISISLLLLIVASLIIEMV